MDMTGAMWRKSSRSSEQGDACVELATTSDFVVIRDSKDVNGPKIAIRRSDFRRFAETLKNV